MRQNLRSRLHELEAKHREDLALLRRLKTAAPEGVDLEARAASLTALDEAAKIDAGVIEVLREIVATTPEATTAIQRFGRVLYWLGCGLAVAIILLGVSMLIGDSKLGVPFAVAVLTVAVLVWLAGWGCRYVLSGY
jgi:hypothetical protein